MSKKSTTKRAWAVDGSELDTSHSGHFGFEEDSKEGEILSRNVVSLRECSMGIFESFNRNRNDLMPNQEGKEYLF